MKTRKAGKARSLTTGIGVVLCIASMLVSLAVLLAFFTQRWDVLDASLSSQSMATIGIALLLVAVSISMLEARRARPIKKALATAALLCTAGGAVLVWSGLDHTSSVKDQDASIAKAHHGSGSGWKSLHGGGRNGSRADGDKSHRDGAASASPGSSDEPSAGKGGAEQATSSSSANCDCYSSPGNYAPPRQESWSPEPSQEYESGKSYSEESWDEDEGWDEEDEGWDEEGWDEEDEGWDEEGWDEEGEWGEEEGW